MSLSLSSLALPSFNWRTILLTLLVLLIVATVVYAFWVYEWRTGWKREGPYESCSGAYNFWWKYYKRSEKWACWDDGSHCYFTGEATPWQFDHLACEP